ncbi:hypothetical protein Bca52824_047021 [Brassica carinata]|uniref:Uncharacterized protein n=1 Tax=Brassica carinata TaxID=52824 RepID=A0A8X7UQU6_BRACI|nr:hypothetical protein Bca52824_047021 [Brassica carinata]
MEKKEKSSLAERLFSLSIKDILNRDLYKHQIKPIPDRFRSAEEYRRCFVPHLLEETRTELSSTFKSLSRSPVFEIHSVEIKEGSGSSSNSVYEITLKNTGTINATYQPKCGDVIALTKERPRRIDDLNPLHLAYVFFSDGDLTVFVRSARAIPSLHEYPILPYKQNGHLIRFGVFLMNTTTNIRIWNALHNEDPSSTLIQSVLQENSLRKTIPDRFGTVDEYVHCFIPHLLEETRTELFSSLKSLSRSPVFFTHSMEKRIKESSGSSSNTLLYDITLSNEDNFSAKYQPKCGDLIALTKTRPRRIDDLDPLLLAYVFKMDGDLIISVHVSRSLSPGEKHSIRFGVSLTTLTTNTRIWNALHNEAANSTLIQSVLQGNNQREQRAVSTRSQRRGMEQVGKELDSSDKPVGAVCSTGLQQQQRNSTTRWRGGCPKSNGEADSSADEEQPANRRRIEVIPSQQNLSSDDESDDTPVLEDLRCSETEV